MLSFDGIWILKFERVEFMDRSKVLVLLKCDNLFVR